MAGGLAGVAGLLVFLVLHHLWIMPIWFILPVGLILAVGGGLAVGWAYHELLPGLPPRPWTMAAMMALMGLTLLPAIVLAQLRPPLFVGTGANAVLTVSVGRAVFIFVVELLWAAAVIGGLSGWLIGRTRRAAVATALAGFVFALGPGHNLPFLGNTTGTGKGLALLAAMILTAVIVLVEGHAALLRARFSSRWDRATESARQPVAALGDDVSSSAPPPPGAN